MQRRHFCGLTGLAALAASRFEPDALTGATAVGQEDQRARSVARLIEARMAEYRVPGVAFALLDNDELTLRGYGLTNLDNPQPVTPDTVFPIASISKTVVSTAMMRLVEEGRIDVDAPVRAYIPDFRVADEGASRGVLIRHLLTHTPGWEGQLGTPDRGPETLSAFVTSLRELPQLAPPGAVWSYNNAGFGVAGRVLEVVTGETINDALGALVFEPLGLTHAFSRTGTAMTYRFAAPHREREGRTVVIRPFRLPANVSAGGLAMSVASLMAYARFHLGDGIVDGRRIMSRTTIERMRETQVVKNATTDEMGLGWHLRRVGGVRTAAHGGTLGGHCLHLQLVPERRLAFAILTNHNQGWRLIQDVERAILEAYEGLALSPGQATGGNRGGNEVMAVHAEPLGTQPLPAPYVGRYSRPPNGSAEVTASGRRLVIAGGGAGDAGASLVFWGTDLAYAVPPDGVDYPYLGMPIEFVRRPDGSVGWVRINGRIAAKDL